MNVLKKQLLKSMIRLTITENKLGRLTVYVSKMSEMSKQCREYDKYVVRAINLLNGIEHVSVDCNAGKVMIDYNSSQIAAEKIFRWMNVIVNSVIDSLDFIEKYGQNQPDYTAEKIEELLKNKLRTFNK